MSSLCRSSTWVRPVLGQGGDLPVVVTTGPGRCRRCSSCGCGRPLYMQRRGVLRDSEGASDSVYCAV